MNNRQKQKAIRTPAGVAKFANISKPKLNFKKTGEEYSVDLVFEPTPEIEAFQAQLVALAEASKDEAIKNAKSAVEKKKIGQYRLYLPIEDELDKETGEPTGKLLLKAKNSASFVKDGVEQKRSLPVFDAKGKPAPGLNIGRGSTLKVSVVPNGFTNPAADKYGVSLWLKAVQVINLVEYGGGNAESFGFGEEDGFTVSDDTVAGGSAPDANEEF